MESSIRAHQEEVLKYIKTIKKVNEDDKERMEAEITEGEVGKSMKNTRNNLSPGHVGNNNNNKVVLFALSYHLNNYFT